MNAAAPLFAKALALTTGSLLATANISSQPAAAQRPLATIATANYTITYICTAGPGCTLGNGYEHTYSLSINAQGAINGTGTQTGYPQIQEKVAGAMAHRAGLQPISLNYLSTYDGLWFVGYTITASGSVDAKTGALTGEATASMPGNPGAAAKFGVKGIRTSMTYARGHDKDGIGDNDTSANTSSKDEDKEKPELKTGAKESTDKKTSSED